MYAYDMILERDGLVLVDDILGELYWQHVQFFKAKYHTTHYTLR